jgi:hypothetical protein
VNMTNPAQDAREILNQLSSTLPPIIDGKSAIEQMYDGGSRHWKQMEWIGFWFEFFVEKELMPALNATRGPRYGMTEFDLKTDYVWDLKAHPESNSSLILNDQEAVGKCISENGGLGFIILHGEAKYDETGEFKAWHDAKKGKRSAYENQRIADGRPSRRRKVSFTPTKATAVFLENSSALEDALRQGWLKSFQEGMRNADGRPRRSKYMISNADLIDPSAVMGTTTLIY